MSDIKIPDDLKPKDGRFGCGPSKIRSESLNNLLKSQSILGTSHRQKPVKNVVNRVRTGLNSLFNLPEVMKWCSVTEGLPLFGILLPLG